MVNATQNQSRRQQRWPIALFLACALIAQGLSSAPFNRVAHAAAAPLYTVIDLGTLGGSFAGASGINNAGQVVGSSTLAGDPTGPLGIPINHAFLYSGGQMADLGTLGGSFSYSPVISDTEQVAGTSSLTGDPLDPIFGFLRVHAFRYSGGSLTDLGTLGGTDSYATGINRAGQVCGVYVLADFRSRGFLFSNGVMSDIETLGGTITVANGINNNGFVVGQSGTPGNAAGHAFLYNSGTGTMTDLGTLGGFSSSANALNDAGQVVGDSYLAGNPLSPDGYPIYHAFRYSGGGLTDLGTLPGDLFSRASGINAAGQVIGASFTSSSERVFLYSDGIMQDLNTLIQPGPGWQISGAWGINNAGQIAATGTLNGGPQRALLLTTPSQLINNLMSLVQSFNLPAGIRNALLSKLRAATTSANAGDSAGACDQLTSFSSQVTAQTGKSISPAQASQLLAAAGQAKTALNCL